MEPPKRKRVAFAGPPSGVEESKGDEPRSKRPRGTDADISAFNADAVRAAKNARTQKRYEDAFEGDSSGQEVTHGVVGTLDASEYEDVDGDANDDGVEQEDGLNATAYGKKGLNAAKFASADGDDEDGNKKQRTVKVLQRVTGERTGRLEEEFNDAGEAFEPFHLQRERDEGYFDTGGNYVWKKKKTGDYDAWLDDLDTMDPRARAKIQAHAAKQAGQAEANLSSVNDLEDGGNSGEESEEEEEQHVNMQASQKINYLGVVVELLHDDETVADALRRFGGKLKISAGKDMKAFNRLTDAADALLRDGMVDIYTMPKKELSWELQDLCSDSNVPVPNAAAPSAAAVDVSATAVSWQPPQTNKQWMYKWSLDEGSPEFGPYSSAEMAAWNSAKFFSTGTVFVRAVKAAHEEEDGDDIFSGAGTYKQPTASSTGAWVPIAEVVF